MSSVFVILVSKEAHTVPTNHLYNQTTLNEVGLILDMTFATLDGCVSVSSVSYATFENREQCLSESTQGLKSFNTLEYI